MCIRDRHFSNKTSLVDQFLPVPGCVKLLLLANWKWSRRDLFFANNLKHKWNIYMQRKFSGPVPLCPSLCQTDVINKYNEKNKNKFWNQQKFSWSVSLCPSLCEIDVTSKYTGNPVRKAPQVLGKPSKEQHRCFADLAKSTTGAL